MTDLIIKSRKINQIYSFWMPTEGGYVFRVYPGRPGTLGEQLLKENGSTISANPETFERICRNWYKKQLRKGTL